MKRHLSDCSGSTASPSKKSRLETAEEAVIDLTEDADYDSDATEIVETAREKEKRTESGRPPAPSRPVPYVDPRISLTRVEALGSAQNVGSKTLGNVFGLKDIECMLQLNYMVQLTWMMRHLPDQSIPITFVHGLRQASAQMLRAEASQFPNVKLVSPDLPIAYGTHHTKAMFIFYKDGDMQVIIHTANMIQQDWKNKTQGIWSSPVLKKRTDTSNAESAFGTDLIEYLRAYGSSLRTWCDRLEGYDFTPCKAVIIGSVPGRHSGVNLRKWGHIRLRTCLQQVKIPEQCCKKSILVGQFSSIGSLGVTDDWLTNDFGVSLSAARNRQECSTPNFKLVFPTVENVRTSFEGWAAGGSIPFDSKNWVKQESWMRPRLNVWAAQKQGRARAMPHIKTFARLVPDTGEIAWILLTSSNLSKAAWGSFEKKGEQLMVEDFQNGTMRNVSASELPSLSLTAQPAAGTTDFIVPIRLPYDLPLTPYRSNDVAWTWDSRQNEPDSLGYIKD
ncbi:tyrosyl-DNA phosphodiesterase-domain-containing protein [Fimicolochytrium jonesii]|uniref:tyrosyl-DNA phosphodiesterase-domain-containing protein n=1 Tax=Fimicolochytrium jonesii TaxID=1396493 RepID=UPI0022FE5E49|nr:tyrosyl-DNA phosphodiesterase-domain-containing protein [Fimicolochytrium jonesii]KAI8822250.1 tyrosyl-DNA phosphodiesterase-domain-containing protein [Fimicolochytrium jonesii]